MAESTKEKPKKKFQMPNTYVILFAVIAFIALLTWFVPGGAYDSPRPATPSPARTT